MSIKPGSPVPYLRLPIVGGGEFELSGRQPLNFTMIVVYRGLHCPICKGYLQDLERRLDHLGSFGVEAVAISTDSRDRAEQARTEWALARLTIAYGLSIADARKWGLFISAAISESEPPLFAEPALFLVRPDGRLYCSSIQTMPFTRPPLAELERALGFITGKNYPARGEA